MWRFWQYEICRSIEWAVAKSDMQRGLAMDVDGVIGPSKTLPMQRGFAEVIT